jgi:hypothetical protein
VRISARALSPHSRLRGGVASLKIRADTGGRGSRASPIGNWAGAQRLARDWQTVN